MIKVYPYEELGQADFGWLKARYHFSFGPYQNPQRTGFGDILVINDDRVAPDSGFDPHPHRNMEIITYVRGGAITHEDSLGNKGRTAAGDIQVMSAGSGIRHAEYNHESEETTLYQIWIKPREQGVKPRWDTRGFPVTPVSDKLPLLVSGCPTDQDREDLLYIHANARFYGGRLEAGTIIHQPVDDMAYLLISEGEITCDGQTLKKGDGAEITDMKSIEINAVSNAELVLIVLDCKKVKRCDDTFQ